MSVVPLAYSITALLITIVGANTQNNSHDYLIATGEIISKLQNAQKELNKYFPDSDVPWRSSAEITTTWLPPVKIELTHIPKTGGSSLGADLEQEIGKSRFYRKQKCFDAYKRKGYKNVVFLRDPRRHVYSQFAMCRDSDWGKASTEVDASFPRTDNRTADYIAFLQHFTMLKSTQVGYRHDFNCIDPRNIQARHLSCRYTTKYLSKQAGDHLFPHPPNHALRSPPNLTKALHNLQHAHFVGITDLYDESMCLLLYFIYSAQDDGVSEWIDVCMVTHPPSLSSDTMPSIFTRINHGIGYLPATVLQKEEIIDSVDKLTRLDRVLYVNALLKFLRVLYLAEIDITHNHRKHCLKWCIMNPTTLEKIQAILVGLDIELDGVCLTS